MAKAKLIQIIQYDHVIIIIIGIVTLFVVSMEYSVLIETHEILNSI